MRTTLFLSSLFAVTLVSGAALAEKPGASSTPARMPRALEKVRIHGDIVGKVYRGSNRTIVDKAQKAATPERVRPTRNPLSKVESRINCSNTGVDCGAPRARNDEKASGLGTTSVDGARERQPPAFLQKILGSDRMQCNEADECSMSQRAARRAWSRASNGQKTVGDRDSHGTADSAASAGAQQAQQQRVEKVRTRRSEVQARMVCNEADECMMSSKEAKKIWAYEAVKAGTWKGPAAKSKTPAEKAIEDAKKNH
jgi:hypothetical protein